MTGVAATQGDTASARISVLMPVRDAAPWLPEALASLAAQTEESWELLAVDDGSRDGSRALLRRWAEKDARVRVLETVPERRGIVAALNAGLAAAAAPLLARMDADDVSHPQRLAMQAAVLARKPCLFGSCCRVQAFPTASVRDGMSRYLAWQNGLESSVDIARDRFVESPMLHPSIMVRTVPLRDRLGGWVDCGWPEDWDLFLRAFELGLAFERVGEVLVRWRLHPRQATRTDPRYSPDSLCAARAHFLARALRCDPRPVWLLGAGPVGKTLAKALWNENVPVAGFAEIDRRKIGGRVHHAAYRWPVISMNDLFALEPRPRAVAAVGRAGARERIREELAARGWLEGGDFFAAA